MSFKIIGIDVPSDCKSEHSKNLLHNFAYHFYNNFKIDVKNKEVHILENNIDLYSYYNLGLKINVSAIVGKNGSGKSTIIELLIKAINNLFYSYTRESIKKNRSFHPVKLVSGIELNIYYIKDETMFRLYVKDSYYEIFSYEENKNTQTYINPKKIKENFNLTNFFYTEVINYSLYAYNSNPNYDGDWIAEIFHKNDSYQTPIVLNPFRKQGNIDIQTENNLVFQRLLANLVRYDHNKNLNLKVGDNLEVADITMKLSNPIHYAKKLKKDTDVNLTYLEQSTQNDILEEVVKIMYNISIPQTNVKILRTIKMYIIYKLVSICSKYEEYSRRNFFDFEKRKFVNLESLIRKLKKDHSHITFKLRQTLNYLLLQHIPYQIDIEENSLPLKNLAISISKLPNKNIIEYLPPPIFKVDLKLSSKLKKNIKFSTLSSGEKQQIYSVNSIYYHLINLDSVKNSTDRKKLSYKNVNIILEEIELYFHPEFQRNYVKILIDGIYRLNLKHIKAVNFIFVTHSPFILSDLPSTNILYLFVNDQGRAEEHKPIKTKSFAANIHHLLEDNFFFGKGVYMGGFAENKVNEVINFIRVTKREQTKQSINDISFYHEVIQLIDEPILKNKLLEMFYEVNQFKTFLESKSLNIEEELIKSYAKRYNKKIKFE